MQKLFLIVTVMKFKFGLNRPKRFIRFLPPRKQETNNFLNVIPRPKNEIHLLSTANYILENDGKGFLKFKEAKW